MMESSDNYGETSAAAVVVDNDDLLEWEEWDGRGHFWQHCVAGSIAGVSEHTLTYPFDTVKTHLQACAECPHVTNGATGAAATRTSLPAAAQHALSNGIRSSSSSSSAASSGGGGMWTTMRHIVSQAGTAELNSPATASSTATTTTTATTTAVGMTRLWRGVYTIVIGCIPAHALYFSTYEATKYALSRSPQDRNGGNMSPVLSVSQVGMIAGATAAFSHDVIMAPLDTVKQRLQLGHYKGMADALHHMIRLEGYACLLRSFPLTLLTNIPYGAIMVSTNEVIKQKLMDYHHSNNNNATTTTTIMDHHSSTYHQPQQQQQLTVSTCLLASSMGGMVAAATTTPLDRIKTILQTQQLKPACGRQQGSCPQLPSSIRSSGGSSSNITSWRHAVRIIVQSEGPVGFFRGLVPRVITHTPAVAISWTTYETTKQWLTTTLSS